MNWKVTPAIVLFLVWSLSFTGMLKESDARVLQQVFFALSIANFIIYAYKPANGGLFAVQSSKSSSILNFFSKAVEQESRPRCKPRIYLTSKFHEAIFVLLSPISTALPFLSPSPKRVPVACILISFSLYAIVSMIHKRISDQQRLNRELFLVRSSVLSGMYAEAASRRSKLQG